MKREFGFNTIIRGSFDGVHVIVLLFRFSYPWFDYPIKLYDLLIEA